MKELKMEELEQVKGGLFTPTTLKLPSNEIEKANPVKPIHEITETDILTGQLIENQNKQNK